MGVDVAENKELAQIQIEIWKTLDTLLYGKSFERYRTLPSQHQSEKNKEKDAFTGALRNLLEEIPKHFDELCKKNNIWVLLNYSSLFLKDRLNVISPRMIDAKSIGEEGHPKISWYDLFGRINEKAVLKIYKKEAWKEDFEIKKVDSILSSIAMPIGDGINGAEGNDRTSYIEYAGAFKYKISSYRGVGNVLAEKDNKDIAEELFTKEKLSHWNECLVFSSKYDLDFSDSMSFFPNILFFKNNGGFSDNDLKLCAGLNDLYVNVVSKIIDYENDILVGRLEDLVGGKPQRIFDKQNVEKLEKINKNDESSRNSYSETVSKIFNDFIEEHLVKTHPIIENTLVGAFYIYWTSFFKSDSDNYLYIEPWAGRNGNNKYSFDDLINNLSDPKQKNSNSFDFKNFIFDMIGEKASVEFERLPKDKFKDFIGSLNRNGSGPETEFFEITIGDEDHLSDDNKKKYYGYLSDKLTEIKKYYEGSIENSNKKENRAQADPEKIAGAEPAHYFSNFCKGKLINTDYRYIYYIPSANYNGKSLGGFSFFCKNKWPRNLIKAAQDWATRFGATFSEIEAKKEIIRHGTKAAIASIMGRNMSHNIGSHVLSTLDYNEIADSENLAALINAKNGKTTPSYSKYLMDFHGYLQKRMDLIARITGKKPNWGEPIFFVGDLLRGFFSQHILLNNLVSDQGVKQIKFIVKKDNNEIEFTYQGEKFRRSGNEFEYKTWLPEKQNGVGRKGFDDFLISIPDGAIGAQAFYVFMEGLMRNSAKYGIKQEGEPFTIYIDVDNGSAGCYGLRIYNNFAVCDGELIKKIRGGIKDPLIDSDGNPTATMLGIAEMREACDFLIYPYKENFPANPANKNSENKYPLWAYCKPHGAEPETGCASLCSDKFLTYAFNLSMPKMVALANWKGKFNRAEMAKEHGIEKIDRHALSKKEGAFQFALLFVKDVDEANQVKDLIKLEHFYLPQRVMIVCSNGVTINNICPERRAIVCNEADIQLSLLEGDPKYDEFIINVYETWITKKLNGKYIDLTIYFERTSDVLKQQWCKIKKTKVLSEKADLLVKIDNDGGNKRGRSRRLVANGDTPVIKILYDNHRAYAEENGNNFDFKHDIGSGNKKIYETMANPPQSDFGFNYFLLGLIEAGLVKVGFIDERVAAFALKEENSKLDHSGLDNLMGTCCYPLFSIKNGDSQRFFLEKGLEKFACGEAKFIHEDEGVRFNDGRCMINFANEGNSLIELKDLDIIVMHKGIIESIMRDGMKLKANDNIVKKLYKKVPSIIVTSGRGKVDADIPFGRSPFIEASTIKENAYPSLSKYHLVRALMSTKENIEKENME